MGFFQKAFKVFGKKSVVKKVRSLVSGDNDIYFQYELKDSWSQNMMCVSIFSVVHKLYLLRIEVLHFYQCWLFTDFSKKFLLSLPTTVKL